MKNIILSGIFIFNFFSVLSQGWQLSSAIKGSNIEPKYSAIDNQNSLYILSLFADSIYNPLFISFGANDIFLTKYSSNGNLLWYKRIGNRIADVPGGITVDNNNNVYITGTYYDTCKFDASNKLINTGNGDVFLAKYNSNGDLLFSKRVCYSSTLQSSIDLKYDGSQKILMTGFFKDSLIIGSTTSDLDTLQGNSNTSNFVAAFDLNGTHLWSKRFLGNNNLSRFRRVDMSQNGYYFGGYFQGNVYLDIDTISSFVANTYDAFIYKTDFNGNGQWVRRIRGQNTENFRTLTTDEYDNVYVLGNYNSPTIYVDSTATDTKTYSGNTGGYDTFIGKYNRSGILQWFIRKGSTAKDIYNDFVIRNNLIYATGYFANQIIFQNDTLRTDNPLNEDAFLAAFNEIGDPIAGVSIKGTGNYNDAGTVVQMGSASRAYVAGYYRSQQIQIGSQVYTSSNVNKSDLFFAIYQHPFKAVITDEQMVSCYGLNDGMLKVTPYFGRPPYTYSWSHNPSLNQPVASNLPADTYTVTVTDADSRQAFISAQVTQPDPLNTTGIITPVSCYNGNDGAIDITVTGGTKTVDYDYFWTSADGSGVEPLDQDQTGLTRGTYTVFVRDDNNCTDTTDFLVTQPGRFNYAGTVVSDITIPPGNNGAIDLSVTGGNVPYGYSWTGPGGFTASMEDISGLGTAGLYNLHLTDQKSCTSDTSFAVNDNFTMVAQITAKTDVLCYGDDNGTATVTVYNGLAPFTYQWSDGVTIGLATRTGMSAGPYTVLVTDANLNTAEAFVQINGPSAGINLTLAKQDLRCYHDNSGVIDLTVYNGTLPYSFSWSNGYTGEDLVNVPAALYTITVTDANGCTAMSSENVTEPPPIGLDITVSGEILCYGDNTVMATANASGGTGSYSYLWDDPGNQVTKTAYELGAGNYGVKVTDQNGCYVTGSTLITQPDSLYVELSITEPSCNGDADGAIIPSVSGGTPGYDYVWSNGVYQRINADIPADTYTLTVTDQHNCSIVKEIILNDPPLLVIDAVDSVNASCYSLADGSITITASGGTGALEYSPDNGMNFFSTPEIGSLAAGSYMVVARDANNCLSAGYPVSIGQPDEIVFLSVDITDATCYGDADGSVTISASGGTGAFEYSADNGDTYTASPVISALLSGSHQLRVRDEALCESAAYPVTIGPDEPFLVDTVEVVRIDATHATGSVTLTSSGGISPVSFVIVPDSISNASGEFVNLQAGDYRLFAYDANLCRSNDLLVSLAEGISILVIYDAFSPNADGRNDVWHIGGIGNYPNCTVKIYNIWGAPVFTSNGYGEPWDGKHNGNDLPSGTYYYVIDPGDGSEILSGSVNIVK
jgi:gliding motility-associated-like protein